MLEVQVAQPGGHAVQALPIRKEFEGHVPQTSGAMKYLNVSQIVQVIGGVVQVLQSMAQGMQAPVAVKANFGAH